jgi:glycosyltransferase involved in cell wall biosynthesis
LITGITDFEVVVADLNSEILPWAVDLVRALCPEHGTFPVGVLRLTTPDRGFNKCRALNAGLDVAGGSTITFLDVDAIVGPRWLEGVRHLDEDPSLIRLCYRVWQLHEDQLRQLNDAVKGNYWEQHVDKLFDKFNTGKFTLRYEAYHQIGKRWKYVPSRGWRGWPNSYGPHVWGNSQFSMRRADIGGLRYDEVTFPQGDHEDLDFLQQINKKFEGRYVGQILTDPDHGMLHIFSAGEPDWYTPAIAEKQKRAYRKKWGLVPPRKRKRA